MEIAGVNFRFKGELDPESFLRDQKAFDTFLGTDVDDSLKTVEIELSFDPPPVNTSMLKIFDGDTAWQIFKDRNKYCFLYHPPSNRIPLWSAYFDISSSTVSVYLMEPPYDKNFFPYLTSLLRTLTMYMLFEENGLIVHGAGIDIDGCGIIFSGKSGSGKSTISTVLNRENGHAVLSDERIVVHCDGREYSMSGTPWHSDAEFALNKSVKLSAICFIHHGATSRVEPIDAKAALARLIPVATIPWYDSALIQPMLDFCGKIVADIPVYDFWVKPDAAVAAFLSDLINRLPDA